MSILLDVILLTMVAFVCIVAYRKGLLISIFHLVSSVLAIVLSFFLYPVISDFLKGTNALKWLKSPIQTVLTEKIAFLSERSPESMLAQFRLPEPIFKSLLNTIETVSVSEMVASVSAAVAEFVLDVICMLAVFVIVKIGLLFVKRFLEKITEIPILKQIDKTGGVVFGLLEAFIFLTVLGALFSLFSGNVESHILNMVENSFVAKFFYQQNLFILFLSNQI